MSDELEAPGQADGQADGQAADPASDAVFREVVGKHAKALDKVGIRDLDGLLRHFPRRFIDPGIFTDIRGLHQLPDGEDVVLHVTVAHVSHRSMQSRRGQITTVTVVDPDGASVDAVFFHQPWLQRALPQGQRILLSAKIKHYRGELQLSSPSLLNAQGDAVEGTDGEAMFAPTAPVPVYRAVGKLKSATLRRLILAGLDRAPASVFEDPIPDVLRAQHGLMDLRPALTAMHRPQTMEEAETAQRRWPYEEALALQTVLLQRRREHAVLQAAALPGKDDGTLAAFDAALPFALTPSQQEAGEEIGRELAKDVPMNRLLQGDVGSGKTLVALRTMLQAVDSGAQAALLAPTEVLAAQHFRSLVTALGDFAAESALLRTENGVVIALLTGSLSTQERRRLLLDLAIGDIDIVVGTHALISDTTIFQDLGVVVVDEQHRFGVEQREALRQKAGGRTPHTLVMTATPIPRTAAMTVFGDLDVTTLTHLPAGPKRIQTHLVPLAAHPHWLNRVVEVMGEHAARGEQSFVVVPRIDSAEPHADTGQPQPGVEDVAHGLAGSAPLVGRRIEVLHGRMAAEDKDTIMRDFAGGDIDVLVSTTVIEVGIDVPNARVMVILDADRFGVAQLHQLRGRVGRAGDESLCFLLTYAPQDSDSFERLSTVAGTLDGFALAEFDIRSRREGDVLGRAQWGGTSSLRHLSVLRDEEIITAARKDADALLDRDPALRESPALARLIALIFADADEDLIEAS